MGWAGVGFVAYRRNNKPMMFRIARTGEYRDRFRAAFS
jgi:hypothetical protein